MRDENLRQNLMRGFGAGTDWGMAESWSFRCYEWTATTCWFGGPNICLDSI